MKNFDKKIAMVLRWDFMIIRHKPGRNDIEEPHIKEKFLIKTYIKVVFRYAEHHVNGEIVFGYEGTWIRIVMLIS